MSTFDEEMNRGLDDIVKRVSYRDSVNPEDKQDQKIAEDFRALPVSQSEVKEKVSESVDGLPVKDRDLLDNSVEDAEVGGEYDEENVVVSEGVEVVRGDLEGNGPPEPEEQPEETEEVPNGNIKEITRWVGDDKERAQAALDAENEREDKRSTLIEKLKDVIGE